MERTYLIKEMRERAIGIARNLGLRGVERAVREGCYSSITESLKRVRKDEGALSFLEQFFGSTPTEKEPYFPNGVPLSNYMNRIIKTKWFSPTKRYTESNLAKDVQRIRQSFKIENDLSPCLTEDINFCRDATLEVVRDAAWYVAWYVAEDVVRDAALEVVRGAALEVVRDAALEVVRDAALEVVRDVAWYVAEDVVRDTALGAQYTIVQDLLEIKSRYPKNPGESLLRVYEKGLWPRGTKGNKFVIWHPPIRKKKS
jgi:hypothetical protein